MNYKCFGNDVCDDFVCLGIVYVIFGMIEFMRGFNIHVVFIGNKVFCRGVSIVVCRRFKIDDVVLT